ncbi:MAG: NAD(P)-binding protein, partial [Halobacteria archaeon]|nr:NAD(P)-binding protein [Halobacteria archaeon]
MRTGIIGGGITGLALNHYLQDQGAEASVFEADSEPGGVIKTKVVDGRVLELGPQRMRLTPGIESLVNELGIDDDIIEADKDLPLYIYHNGNLRKVPFSLREMLTTNLLSW